MIVEKSENGNAMFKTTDLMEVRYLPIMSETQGAGGGASSRAQTV